jgi:hypothetical protein
MINIINGKVFFEEESEDKCELCGVVAELRPYGPNGENICCPCGDKNPEATEARMNQALDASLAAAGVSLNEVTLVDPDPVVAFLQEIISDSKN